MNCMNALYCIAYWRERPCSAPHIHFIFVRLFAESVAASAANENIVSGCYGVVIPSSGKWLALGVQHRGAFDRFHLK